MHQYRLSIYTLVAFLIAISTSAAQLRVPNTDDEGKIKLPSARSIRDFHARLPAEQIVHRQPDEASQDKTLSLTLFGQGRLAYQQATMLNDVDSNEAEEAQAVAKYEESLAAYQRAWFWNPSPKAKVVLSDIVAMAFHLKRQEVGIRYATLASEYAPRDPLLMEQLGMILAQKGDAERGLKMLQSALATHLELAAAEDPPADPKNEELAEIHLSLARLSMLNKDYAAAAESFDLLRDVVANPADYKMDVKSVSALIEPATGFYGLMGESFLLTKQFDKTESIYKILDELNNSDPLNIYHTAVLAFERGNVESAKAELKKYFDSESQDAGQAPYELLKEIVEKEKPKEEQDKTFLRAIRKLANRDPANAVLAEYAGALFVDKEQYQEAQELLEPLLGGQPTVVTFSSLLKVYHKLDLPGKTVALLGVAVDARGDLRLVEESLKEFAADEKSIQSLLAEANRRRADKQRPMAGSEAFGVGLVCLAAKDVEQADQFYNASVKQTRDEAAQAERQLTWAEEAFFADHLPAARKYFTAALENPGEDTNIGSVTELLAMAHELDGATEEALDVLDIALADDPDSAGLLTRRGWVLYHASRNEEAADAYKQVLDKFADDYSSEQIRRAVKDARSIYSNIFVERDQLETGSELLLQVLDEYPEDVGARNDLGYLWADANVHTRRALQMAKEAVAAEPDNSAYLDTLAWALYRVGEFPQALVQLERATGELKADDSVILDHLGDVYQAVGNGGKANETWKKAAQSLEKFVAEEKREMTDKERADLKKIQDKIDQ